MPCLQVHVSQLERGGEVVERIGIGVFVERLPVMILQPLAYIPLDLQPDTVQLEVHPVQLVPYELGVGRGEKLEVHLGAIDLDLSVR